MDHMTDIAITKQKEEPGAKQLRVEVALGRVETAEQKAAAYYAKRVKLPGFRKGKVPLNVVRKKFRDAIRENVIRELVEESWKAAVEQESLQPIADPQVRNLRFEDGAPITFELTVAVKPELVLDRLGDFQLVRKIPRVTDSMVEMQLEDIRRQRAPWVPVEERKPERGELVSVTITPLEEGEPKEGKQYQIVLGDGQALPDVEDRVMELLPGEQLDTTVKLPETPDQSTPAQRSVRILLHEVKRQELPELSDEFAREVGDFESADALRAAVRADLEAAARKEADGEVRRQVIEQIESANSVEAPRPMVQQVMSAFAKTYQIPDDQFEKFATEFAPIAERQVKRDLIIDHVAEKEHLRASEEDIDARIEEIAKSRNTDPAKMYASLQKANRLGELERSITEEKVFKYLIEHSTVSEVTE